MFRKTTNTTRSKSGRHSRKYGRLCSCGGFTMMELIVIIIMVGILAAVVAMKSGFLTSGPNVRIALDQVVGDLRFIQCRAMAAYSSTPTAALRSATFLNGANTYNLGGQVKSLPSGVTVSIGSALTVTFNSLGEYNTTANGVLTLRSGGSTGSIMIYMTSGDVEAY
jgi:Tfp pilus assembly protein FimT